MEKELERKIFLLDDYIDELDMEIEVKEYIKRMKKNYINAIVTREFYKGKNVLVRVTQVYSKNIPRKKEKEKEIDDWYIRQRE